MTIETKSDHCWLETYDFDDNLQKSIIEMIGKENAPHLSTLLELVRGYRFHEGEDNEETPLRDVKREIKSVVTFGKKMEERLFGLSLSSRELLFTYGSDETCTTSLYSDLKSNLRRLSIAWNQIGKLTGSPGRPPERARADFLYRLAEWLESDCKIEVSTSEKGVFLPLAQLLLASVGRKTATLKEDVLLIVDHIKAKKEAK